jgi:hypothetical protein
MRLLVSYSCFAEISQWFATRDLMATRQAQSTRAPRRIPFLVEEVSSDLVRLDIATGGDSIRDLSRGVKLVVKLAFSSQTRINLHERVVQKSISKMRSSLGRRK